MSLEKVDLDYEIGEISVEIKAYYKKGEDEVPIEINQLGSGVIELNISDPSQLEHYNNFRVDIIVKSTVDTYIRVAVYEQFTLTYMTGDQKIVVAIVKDEYSKLAYQEDFFDNRQEDGFFYYKNKVKRNPDNSQNVISFIGELPVADYHPIYENRYTLQIGFVIDAVQYLDGPLKNWGRESPPWPDNEGW